MLRGRHPPHQPEGKGCLKGSTSYIQVKGRQDRAPGHVSRGNIIRHGG